MPSPRQSSLFPSSATVMPQKHRERVGSTCPVCYFEHRRVLSESRRTEPAWCTAVRGFQARWVRQLPCCSQAHCNGTVQCKLQQAVARGASTCIIANKPLHINSVAPGAYTGTSNTYHAKDDVAFCVIGYRNDHAIYAWWTFRTGKHNKFH